MVDVIFISEHQAEQQSNEKLYQQFLNPKTERSDLHNNVSYCFT